MSVNLARLDEYPVIAPDVETTGLHWYRDKVFGIALAVYDGQKVESEYYDLRERPRVLDALKEKMPKAQKVVNHNMKFDSHFMLNEGIAVPLSRIECTSVRAALINEHELSFSLDALCKKYIGEGKVEIWEELAKMFGGAATRAVQIKNLHRAPSSLAGKYAAPDPALALKLWLWQEKEIEKQELGQIWALEKALTPILVEIERQGVRVDEALATKQSAAIDTKVATAQTALNVLAGKSINVNSAPQMRTMFHVERHESGAPGSDGYKYWWTTDTGHKLENSDGGQGSLDKDAMIVMERGGDKRASHVLTIRRMLKAKSFLKDHICGHAVNGRVWPNYNQTRGDNEKGTGTGRFSIDDPALQQIPMHDIDVAQIVRPCFLPEKGHDWLCADWKQFEFRWFAHYTKDPNILKMYEENPDADFHSTVAGITGITRDRKFAGDTANAKQINLGLVFGMGEGEMAYNMGMEYEAHRDRNGREWKTAGPKAKEIFRKYHDAIPGVRALLQQASSIARSRGYVRTAMGRHIRFPGAKFLHKAGGLTFQGTSADCMKVKMVELWPLLKKEGWPYLLSVHDEHDLSVPKSKSGKAVPVVQKILETFDGVGCPVSCRVPIRSGIGVGANWWEACK